MPPVPVDEPAQDGWMTLFYFLSRSRYNLLKRRLNLKSRIVQGTVFTLPGGTT